jgi:hypothetical protein
MAWFIFFVIILIGVTGYGHWKYGAEEWQRKVKSVSPFRVAAGIAFLFALYFILSSL